MRRPESDLEKEDEGAAARETFREKEDGCIVRHGALRLH
jgi:hypothetical protein